MEGCGIAMTSRAVVFHSCAKNCRKDIRYCVELQRERRPQQHSQSKKIKLILWELESLLTILLYQVSNCYRTVKLVNETQLDEVKFC